MITPKLKLFLLWGNHNRWRDCKQNIGKKQEQSESEEDEPNMQAWVAHETPATLLGQIATIFREARWRCTVARKTDVKKRAVKNQEKVFSHEETKTNDQLKNKIKRNV